MRFERDHCDQINYIDLKTFTIIKPFFNEKFIEGRGMYVNRQRYFERYHCLQIKVRSQNLYNYKTFVIKTIICFNCTC